MTRNVSIATEDVPRCFLCNRAGTLLYEQLHDHLFGAPGVWGFLKCPGCGLVWLSPRPLPGDLKEVYRQYHTHDESGRSALRRRSKRALYSTLPGYHSLAPNWPWKLLGKGLALSSLMKERAFLGTMCLVGDKKGTLLDVGCGNGLFLSIMRDAGWKVVGVEPDGAAAHGAQERYGLTVFAGHLADAKFDDRTFDAITLNHVIEHTFDPVALLSECRRLLKPEGTVVLITPNAEGHGHSRFKSFWRGLEPPRHINVFSGSTLQSCCKKAGLHVRFLRTSERSAAWIWGASHAIQGRQNDSSAVVKWRMQLQGLMFQLRERNMLRTSGNAGEELVAIADCAKLAEMGACDEASKRPVYQVCSPGNLDA